MMSKPKYWKLPGGRYGGITSRGKRFIVKSLSAAKAKLGKSKSRTSKKSKTKTSKWSVRKTTKKKRRRGGRILGNVGWKGLLAGTLGLTLAKYLGRRFLPLSERYVDGAAMVGVGALGKVTKIGTANLLPAGVMMLGSSFIEDLVFGGGVGFVAGARGYDL